MKTAILNLISSRKGSQQLSCLILAAIISAGSLNAQDAEKEGCKFVDYKGKYSHQTLPDGTIKVNGIAVSGSNYDVKYYRINIRVNPDSSTAKYIKGSVTTYFRTTQPNLSQIRFDFAVPLICDSVYYHNSKVLAANVTTQVDTLRINIPNIASSGTLDSVTVYYKGVPRVVPDFGGGTGFVKSTHGVGPLNYIYTLSEPYSSFTWWPCKSFVANDKADSMRLIVSTPSAFKVAANGSLVSEVINGANKVTTWYSSYPIAAYQIAIGVARYDQYPAVPTLVNIGGTNMPFYNYLFPETNTASAQIALNRTVDMLTTLSSKLGDYPFKLEKYGHYTFGFGGGMEHNTFSGMSPSTYNSTLDWNVIAHELGHQWFGANVTCASWRDIWVNESFAEWSESIALEFSPSLSAAVSQTGVSWRGTYKSLATNASNQAKPIYAMDTTSITTIFTPAVYIYERGAMVISMLRILLGDTKFFQAIQNYQSDPLLRYSNALTGDVKRHMEAVSGLNLTEFFNDWIYNTGYPSYNVEWNNNSYKLRLRLIQTPQFAGALTHFETPIAIRIRGALPANDTTVIIHDKNGVMNYVNNGVLGSTGLNTITYNLSFVPTTVTIDAYNQTMATGTTSFNSGLSTLPTVLSDFRGTTGDFNNTLLWQLNTRELVDEIQIERSIDSRNFEVVGTIDPADMLAGNTYKFIDNYLAAGPVYYRIKLIEKSGELIYSKTILLQRAVNTIEKLKISPNPASQILHITLKKESRISTIAIYDINGALVKSYKKESLTNENTKSINVSNLSAGVYYLRVKTLEGETFNERFTISHQ